MENSRSRFGAQPDTQGAQVTMKLHAKVSEYQADIRLRDDGERVFAEIEGRSYDLVFRRAGDSFLLEDDGRIFNCRIDSSPEAGRPLDVVIGTRRYEVTLIDPKRLRSSNETGADTGDAARIIAPMPGKVVRVLVAAGDQIEINAGVVVVEAMKMQNEMKSPKTGIVTAMKVEPGATVNAGDVLAIIE
jgi:biotin carboxyl carrier protein